MDVDNDDNVPAPVVQWFQLRKFRKNANDLQSIKLPQKRPTSPAEDENQSKKVKPSEMPLHLRESGSD